MTPAASSSRPSLDRSRLALADLVAEAIAGIVQRPLRAALTCAGTILGVAAVVATLGIATTAGAQISARFDELAATEVVVRAEAGADGPSPSFPEDSEERLARIDGVTRSGIMWEVDPTPGWARRSYGPSAFGPEAETSVLAASPGALAVMQATVVQGRPYDEFASRRAERVALVGSVVARNLGISAYDWQPVIEIAGTRFTVAGVIEDVGRHPDALLSVVVPHTTATEVWGMPASSPVNSIIEVRPGAAQVVGDQVALALRPEDPDSLTVVTPTDPERLREQVESDIDGMYVLLGAVSLLIGAIGIANTTLVSVIERTNEIGLRRALGATKRHIAAQFLAESAVLGTIGGVIGTSLGVAGLAVVAAARSWTGVIAPATLAAPLIGTVVGLVAGFYPARRAAAIEPVAALRSP